MGVGNHPNPYYWKYLPLYLRNDKWNYEIFLKNQKFLILIIKTKKIHWYRYRWWRYCIFLNLSTCFFLFIQTPIFLKLTTILSLYFCFVLKHFRPGFQIWKKMDVKRLYFYGYRGVTSSPINIHFVSYEELESKTMFRYKNKLNIFITNGEIRI